jgi:uncharacterized protein (TIGR03086 family)
MASDIIDLLDQGFAWTGDRVVRVDPGDLDRATPCEGWALRDLLDHMLASLDRLAAAAEGESAGSGPLGGGPPAVDGVDRLGDGGRAAFAAVRQRALTVWRHPGVMDRTCELPLGSLPAAMAAHLNLVEVVVHGWDISRATGEAAAIPPELARPALDFSRQAVGPARGRAFGPDLEGGDSASDRLVSFLGRKP